MTTTQTELPSANAEAQSDTQKCVFVIFNPVSGTTDPEQRKKSISEALAQHGYTCQFIATSEKVGAKELAEKAIKDGVDLLAVSGGDGTVMEALSALVGSSIPLAVFPAGTGNLLSVNLGIPMTIPEAVHVALNGEVYELDLGRTGDGKYFAIMGGMGLDAQLIADTGRQAKSKFGVLAYFMAALKVVRRPYARIDIHLDGRPAIRSRAKTVLIANMGKITGGLEAVPTASPNDGLLDVGILRSETLGQWLRLLGNALLGRTQDDPDFDVYQARKIVLKTPKPQPVEFDGEEGGHTQALSVEVIPKAVRVLLPEGGPAARDAQHTPAAAAKKAARVTLVPLVLLLGGTLALWAIRRRR